MEVISLKLELNAQTQTATFTPFSSPIPATSHCDTFGFKPEIDENKEIVFSSSFIEPNLFQEKSRVSCIS